MLKVTIKQRIAKASYANRGMDQKILNIKRSLDEVSKILNSKSN